MNGAVGHKKFKPEWFDWKLAGNFNTQMMGLTGGPSQAWLKKQKDKGVTKDIAAQSLYLYLKTMDTQGVLN